MSKPIELVQLALKPFVESGAPFSDWLEGAVFLDREETKLPGICVGDLRLVTKIAKMLWEPVDLDALAEASYIADSICTFTQETLDFLSKETGRQVEAKEFVIPFELMPPSLHVRHRAAARAVAEALGFACEKDPPKS